MTKSSPDIPAFRHPLNPREKGLTIREHIASIALHGLVGNEGYTGVSAEAVAQRAIELADALLEKLSHERNP